MVKIKHLVVASSTYPATPDEKVPRFVADQLQAFTKIDSKLKIDILAPHNQSSIHTGIYPKTHERITEHRFHYFLPAYERLTDSGIMPALIRNKLNYFLIPFLFIGEFFALWKLVRNTKPDLIYVHWFTPQAICANLVSRLTNTPFAYTTHASDVDVWHRFGWLGNHIVRSFSRNAVSITSVSTQTTNKLLQFFNSESRQEIKKKVKVIPMGIYNHATKSDKRDFQSILFIGRFTEKKGLSYLLESLAKIDNVTATIAGDGELRQELESLTQKLGLESRVTFPGYVHGRKKQELLATHGIMVVPSITTSLGDSEGLPVSLMEGLSNGLICVATHASGADDIIENNVHGYLTEQKNVRQLTRTLQKAVNQSVKDRKAMLKATQALAKELDWASIGKRYLDELNKT